MAYPADPADLFARIVGAVELLFDRVDALSWLRDDQVRDIADVIEETALTREDGISPQRTDELFDLADPDDYARRAFAVLLGLDRALMYANPFYGHFDQGAVTQVAVRYAQTGRFNSDATQGVLLPRASFPGRKQYSPNTLNDAFVSVVWIPREEWQSAEHRRTPTRNDFTRIERESGLNVVCVPALDDASERQWRRR